VSFIPSDLRLADIALVAGASLCMCLLASLYPAVRAARLPPAEVLQREV
jgi:lipoprotein-releasing system permease protein